MHGEVAISVNCGVFHQHLVSGDPNVVEGAPAIVFAVVADLGADVTGFNSWHVLECFQVSQLDDEGHDAEPGFVDDEVGEDDCMAGEVS